MKKSLGLWQFLGFGFTALFGTILHFLYDLTDGQTWAAFVSGVNESTWEHMKLLFVPMFVYALLLWRVLRAEYPNYWCANLGGILFGLFLIPALFYAYNGCFGPSPDAVNIAIFFIAAALAYLLQTHLLRYGGCKVPAPAFLALVCLAVLFAVFSFAPPNLPLFLDPITKTYGR